MTCGDCGFEAPRDFAFCPNGRWQARLGTALALHVGVNTGPVVAGSIGADKGGAYAVTGDTVNTASRLQSVAPPGQVLASEATWRLAQHAFAFEPAGHLQVKGRSEPVAAYRLSGLLAAPRSARGLEAHGLVAPLVGREAELATARAVCPPDSHPRSGCRQRPRKALASLISGRWVSALAVSVTSRS